APLADQAGGRVQRRRLASAIAAKKGHELTRRNAERDAMDDLGLAVGHGKILDFQQRAHAPRYTRMTSGSLRTAVAEPCTITRPRLSAVTLSQTRKTKSVWCSTRSTPMPLARITP